MIWAFWAFVPEPPARFHSGGTLQLALWSVSLALLEVVLFGSPCSGFVVYISWLVIVRIIVVISFVLSLWICEDLVMKDEPFSQWSRWYTAALGSWFPDTCKHRCPIFREQKDIHPDEGILWGGSSQCKPWMVRVGLVGNARGFFSHMSLAANCILFNLFGCRLGPALAYIF